MTHQHRPVAAVSFDNKKSNSIRKKVNIFYANQPYFFFHQRLLEVDRAFRGLDRESFSVAFFRVRRNFMETATSKIQMRDKIVKNRSVNTLEFEPVSAENEINKTDNFLLVSKKRC
jgi:hypothetical protein